MPVALLCDGMFSRVWPQCDGICRPPDAGSSFAPTDASSISSVNVMLAPTGCASDHSRHGPASASFVNGVVLTVDRYSFTLSLEEDGREVRGTADVLFNGTTLSATVRGHNNGQGVTLEFSGPVYWNMSLQWENDFHLTGRLGDIAAVDLSRLPSLVPW